MPRCSRTPSSAATLAKLIFGMAALSSFVAQAQAATTYNWTEVARWQEEDRYTNAAGQTLYPQEWYPSKGYDVRPHQAARELFPTAIVGDGNNKATSDNLWAALVTSRNVIGNGTTLTRARDISEDWDINFVNPTVNDRNHWFDWYSDNATAYVSRSAFPLTLVNGPQAGQSILNNQNLLAMGDDNSLWLNPNGTLSYYNYPTGTLEFQTSGSVFTGGPQGWLGSSVTSKLGNLIGYEEGQLYFLEGANTLRIFNYNLGYVRTDEFHFNGELEGYSLADVIDGKAGNASYLGWDLGPVVAMVRTSVVPEPATWATWALGLIGLGVARARRRA